MRLVTHDGTFHYDEVLATAILTKIYPDSEIIRTREESIIQTGDIIYDVGRVYDPLNRRFDHHQNTFNEFFSSKYNVKLSSAGLVFKHFHEKLFEKYGMYKKSPVYEDMVDKVYSEFFLPADAIDNGYDSIFGQIIPRTVADVVVNFNVDTRNSADQERRFISALQFVSKDLDNYLNCTLCYYAPSYESMYNVISNFEGDIFVTSERVSRQVINDICERLQKDIKFVIFHGEGDPRIYSVPKTSKKFELKCPLHAEWWGLAGNELVKASGITGSVFVHANGFTGENKTLEGAIKMCELSLQYMYKTGVVNDIKSALK